MISLRLRTASATGALFDAPCESDSMSEVNANLTVHTMIVYMEY